MKQFLVIGDSISIGYTPHLGELLAGRAEVAHNPGNAQDSANVRRNLDEWTMDKTDVILLNCGLHDIKRAHPERELQQSPQQYAANLRDIFARLQTKSKQILWATTTPVIEERLDPRRQFDRFEADVEHFNDLARTVATGFGVPTADLHRAVMERGVDELIGEDGVHFTPEGYRFLAAALCEPLLQLLNA